MEYKLDKERSLKENINEIFNEEISGCISALKELDIHLAVHDIRKRLKKLRAMARLFRDEMGEEEYKSLNIKFRDLGREISDIRDFTAYLETLERLKLRYGKYLYKSFFNSVEKKLLDERKNMTEELIRQDFFSGHLMSEFENISNDIKQWPVRSNNIDIILPSIERVYQRGNDAMKVSFENPTTENFHEWRKRVKYLWYQLLLLQDTWPQFFETLEAEVHLLADFLGDDHDLMLFMNKVLSEDFHLKDEEQKEMFEALIAEFSDQLRKDAEIKGKLIYAESPEDFRNRIGKYTQVNWN
ncbi:CHAD domain-containing protein [Christiangramia sp. SM2212]|uniref:CHAD domain-containing protein n=1 Tax=Christiangramia sediminicola TaxID=3073267 RepID=A0ABU1EN57_9FLAO|nr:CHAD domain-containing protein [Christiangramia sp. SM2212]MDR5589820.1 CHAD domain-containing protein [Christiangramia sp. SM2212]